MERTAHFDSQKDLNAIVSKTELTDKANVSRFKLINDSPFFLYNICLHGFNPSNPFLNDRQTFHLYPGESIEFEPKTSKIISKAEIHFSYVFKGEVKAMKFTLQPKSEGKQINSSFLKITEQQEGKITIRSQEESLWIEKLDSKAH